MRNRKIVLKVSPAYPEDVGKCKARVRHNVMRKLGLDQGSVISIRREDDIGTGALATAWRLRKDDADRDCIRIDGITRANADISVGDNVFIESVKDIKDATSISIVPILTSDESFSLRLFMNEEIRRLILPELMGRPVKKGDLISVMKVLGGGTLKFKIIRTIPAGIVRINIRTELDIKEGNKENIEDVNVVSYEEIGGLDTHLSRIREMVELPIRHPEIFAQLGIKPPKGVLLYGPPGTGKTLIAKAVASEAGAHFINIQGPEIISRFYGESEAHLREIFDRAEKNAPSIIFIDEIDSIAPKREDVSGELERRVVAQLLTLMDGLKSRGKVIVIAATNRPEALDPALRRPGRFDREIEIPPPDSQGRLEILKIHTRGMPLRPEVNLEHLAEITHGYVGADLAALCREAAMMTLRRFLPEIDLDKQIPQEVLRRLEVGLGDFRRALSDTEPSAVREIYSERPQVSWEDLGGMASVKNVVRETVELPLLHPDRLKKMGISAPKGILLFGPPGTGKTLLCKAVASEVGVNFISINGPEVMSKWVGQSEKAVRNIFKKAKQIAPTIILLDELDSIAPRRDMGNDSHATERVVNQLLTSMDDINPGEQIVIMATTNRPDIIDPALLRSGRFDLIMNVPLPNDSERVDILKVHTRNMPLDPSVDIEAIARKLEDYSGADINNVCREAGMSALRRDSPVITEDDFTTGIAKTGPSMDDATLKFYESIGQELKGRMNVTTIRSKQVEGYN